MHRGADPDAGPDSVAAVSVVLAAIDPAALARHFLLPRDEAIRETDVPEREQLHRGPDPAAFDLAACAAWVWERLAGPARGAQWPCRGRG